MSATAARVVRRIVTAAAAAGGALALFGSMGLSTAYAEPTPDPTPAESVTPTPAATPSSPAPLVGEATPTPNPSESATSPSPAPLVEEATPIPTESGTSPSEAPLVEEATPAPIPTGLPSPSAVESQGVAALAEPVADDRLYVVVLTRCAGGEGDTRVEVLLYLLNDEDLTLDYVLTDDDGITRTGTVTLTPEDSEASEDPHATLEFTGLPVGTYHIDFLTGGGEPVTVQNFEILTCLDTAVSCQQITFANPATNPTVFLGYGPVDDHKDGDDDQNVDLEPGERRVFRADRGVIRWLAGTLEGGAGENFSIAYAGEDDEVSVPSDCEPGPPAAGPDDGLAGPDDGLAGPDDGLADTGGSANAVNGLVGGSVLTAAGATLLLRRRPI